MIEGLRYMDSKQLSTCMACVRAAFRSCGSPKDWVPRSNKAKRELMAKSIMGVLGRMVAIQELFAYELSYEPDQDGFVFQLLVRPDTSAFYADLKIDVAKSIREGVTTWDGHDDWCQVDFAGEEDDG